MTQFVATVNTPGYLPMEDEPPVFDHPWEAWSYLSEERERREDQAEDGGEEYTETRERLAALGTAAHWSQSNYGYWLTKNGVSVDGTGTVYGSTPGYDGDHDLGLAYSVSVAESD